MLRSRDVQPRRTSWVIAVLVLGCLALPAAAQAVPDISVALTRPTSVRVGQKAVPASILVQAINEQPAFAIPGSTSNYIGFCEPPVPPTATNGAVDRQCTQAGYSPAVPPPDGPPQSDPAQKMARPFDQGITLTPSCAQASAPDEGTPLCTASDRGVFTLSPTATGAPGSACAGTTFDVTPIDAELGMVRFKPSAPVFLGGRGWSCQIDFTFDVNKLPAGSNATSGGKTRAFSAAGGYHQADDPNSNPYHTANVKAVDGAEITVTPPRRTCPPPQQGTPPDCRTPLDLVRARAIKSCASSQRSVAVIVQGDVDNVARVVFRRDGRVVKTLRRANKGSNTFVLKISRTAPRPYSIASRVVLRSPGSFKRGSAVLVKNLKTKTFTAPPKTGFINLDKCSPDPSPG